MADYVKFEAPAVVTIANTIVLDTLDEHGEVTERGTAKYAMDPGSEQRHKRYIDTDRKIQFYRVNSYITLKAGDEVKIVAETSEEVAYYLSLATADVTVDAEVQE